MICAVPSAPRSALDDAANAATGPLRTDHLLAVEQTVRDELARPDGDGTLRHLRKAGTRAVSELRTPRRASGVAQELVRKACVRGVPAGARRRRGGAAATPCKHLRLGTRELRADPQETAGPAPLKTAMVPSGCA